VSHATALAKGLALILHVTPHNDVSSCLIFKSNLAAGIALPRSSFPV
jgi:hypothetical protein